MSKSLATLALIPPGEAAIISAIAEEAVTFGVAYASAVVELSRLWKDKERCAILGVEPVWHYRYRAFLRKEPMV